MLPYLNLDLDFFEHPKTRRLVGLLGKGSEVVTIRLWAYCGKYHSEDGKLTGYSAQEIESIVGWWGEQGKMIEALVRVGFLHEVKGGWQIHDWIEHEGHILAFKERAKTAAYARWGIDATSNAPALPTKPTNRGKKNPPDPKVKDFLEHARQAFEKVFNEAMCVDWAKDSAITKSLLGVYGIEKLKGLWDVFLKSDDPFLKQAGRSIGVFKSQINKLLVQNSKKDWRE